VPERSDVYKCLDLYQVFINNIWGVVASKLGPWAVGSLNEVNNDGWEDLMDPPGGWEFALKCNGGDDRFDAERSLFSRCELIRLIGQDQILPIKPHLISDSEEAPYHVGVLAALLMAVRGLVRSSDTEGLDGTRCFVWCSTATQGKDLGGILEGFFGGHTSCGVNAAL